MNKRASLYWFSHDLRLDDNWALFQAAQQADYLLCIYVIEPEWFVQNRFGSVRLGKHRGRFLTESLVALKHQLNQLGQTLLILNQQALQVIPEIVHRYCISHVYRSAHVTTEEKLCWARLKQELVDVQFQQIVTHCLFEPSQLPFERPELPETFSRFRRKVEPLEPEFPLAAPLWLPPPPVDIGSTQGGEPSSMLGQQFSWGEEEKAKDSIRFRGGESAAVSWLQEYFSDQRPADYKQVRNELDGWSHSTKFSPWLSNGSLSVRRLVAALREYEKQVIANESTYWIYFELLWREYFQWYAECHGRALFRAKGISTKAPLTSYYPERFKKWCSGQTQFPLINACMKQLNATGYLSNRGRQLVASCLVNELQLDWRYGAAYLEQQLIDFDPAVNWGNWQYIAGVGADPRGGRHFNLEKQAEQYDPDSLYVHRWGGECSVSALDSMDCADWPISSSV